MDSIGHLLPCELGNRRTIRKKRKECSRCPRRSQLGRRDSASGPLRAQLPLLWPPPGCMPVQIPRDASVLWPTPPPCWVLFWVAKDNFSGNRGGFPHSLLLYTQQRKRSDHIPWYSETFGESRPGKTQRSPLGWTDMWSGSGPRTEWLWLPGTDLDCGMGWKVGQKRRKFCAMGEVKASVAGLIPAWSTEAEVGKAEGTNSHGNQEAKDCGSHWGKGELEEVVATRDAGAGQ